MNARLVLLASVRSAKRLFIPALLALVLIAFPLQAFAQEEHSERELAEELFDRGEFRQALQAYDLMMIRMIDDPNVLHQISFSLLKCERWDRAQAVLERFVEVDPDEPVARYNLGILHWQMDRHYLAIPCFEHIVATDSTYGDAWYCLGHIYLEIGEIEAAWKVQTKLLELGHEWAADLQQALVEREEALRDPVSEWW